MANILLRSPYFVTVTTAGHLSAQMALTIDGTLRYTILKNATSNRTVFEIATLCKDYFVANYNNLDTVSISYVITTYSSRWWRYSHSSKCSNTYRILWIFRVLGWCKSRL